VSEKRNIEPETRIPNTETCIRTETLALVICDLEFLFLQYFSTPKRLAIPTDKECIQLQSTIINLKFYRDRPFEDPAPRGRTKYVRAIPQDSEEGPFKDGN
jgi:hypothetical protein